MLKRPEMILFDYGQTIIVEDSFQPLKGNHALLQLASSNPKGVTAKQVQNLADELNEEILSAYHAKSRNEQDLEMTCSSFNRYLYEYLGIDFLVPMSEIEDTFWDNAAPGRRVEHIEELLEYLHKEGIRTGVVSNIMFSERALQRRINTLLPKNHFEFIMSSSEYMFRKPGKRLFDLALRKANLSADKVWYCGDNKCCDIYGATNAGMKSIWFSKYAYDSQMDLTGINYITLKEWTELIELLSK